MNFDKSQEWLERAKKVIPYPYNQTFSKGPDQYVQGVSPVFIERGSGSYIYDVDGNVYLDLVMGLLSIVLGYNMINPQVFHTSPIYSLPHPKEVELSELLCEIIPCAEMVRLGKNGSDVTSAAVRLARAVTGKDIVLQCGYNGWQDWSMGNSWRNKGIPKIIKYLTIPFKYNDFLRSGTLIQGGDVACVIMEPVSFEEPREDTDFMTYSYNFLQYIRKLCTDNNVILIFDEMITGFRYALGGAQEYYNVTPDLACFGKAMANGWPISAVVGKRDLMEEFGNIHFSTTFGGEIHSIRAALQTINFIKENNVIKHLWAMGSILRNGLKDLVDKYSLNSELEVQGNNIRFILNIEDNMVKSYISQELIKCGILWQGSFNLSYAHKIEQIEKALEVFGKIFRMLSLSGTTNLESAIKGIPIKKRMSIRSE